MITKIKKLLRYDYTDPEKLQFGNELAQCSNEQAEVESMADRMKSEFKAKESAIEAKRLALSNALLSGYTMRDIECEIVMNTPKQGKAHVVRMDTLERVEIRDMTALEIEKAAQMELLLNADRKYSPEVVDVGAAIAACDAIKAEREANEKVIFDSNQKDVTIPATPGEVKELAHGLKKKGKPKNDLLEQVDKHLGIIP